MKKISLAAICQASLHQFGMIALTFLCAVSAFAKNNCDDNASLINPVMLTHSGIGGTGAAQSGVGGTGLHDGGMGGTGNPQGGIGGTGSIANDGGIGGTGIVGVITGFASICVNGIEIHYSSGTTISMDGQPASADELAVGQIVAARALGTGDKLTARNIAVIHAAVGPVSHFDTTKGEMQVLGQTVRIGQGGEHSSLSNLKTGDWVQVSGHRLSSGTIAASRVETIAPRAEARLNGHITQIDEQGIEVNGTRIHHDAKLMPQGLAKGMEISIAGRWDGLQMKAHQVQAEPTRQSIGNVDHVVIEGYIHALEGKELNLSNRIVTLDPGSPVSGNVRSDLRLDQRIQISGRPGADQRINPERIELKQEVPVQLQILERIGNDGIDTSDRGKKNNSGTEPEAKSIHGDKSDQNQGGGSGSGHKGELKKDTDSNSGKDHTSGGGSHGKDTTIAPDSDQKIDRPSSSGKDHDEKPQDSREQNLSGHGSADKPEKPSEGADRLEKSSDHKDNLRDIDTPDRDHNRDRDHTLDKDHALDRSHTLDRDHVLDRDQIRDHSDHRDRDFSHRDRDLDR
ncbi:DUF5666 domain-containing protein [Nitrosomonas sp. Is35]|uniref:DUF5666 domain-containing protein n=1 Tax=Nitrosomonas sp. Is35 TaxID=3080534 RepID=UPI00294AF8A9|nr:DUF5666 domain-containing protein [Nitrosomonas sp. Is35]MDV6346010.1 DUF5666 domain-containing protein [Nitrosomonas sp. Is35]